MSFLPKLRHIIAILLIIGVFWHFYGEAFKSSRLSGVLDEIRTDIADIKKNPLLGDIVSSVKKEMTLFFKEVKSEEDIQSENEINTDKPMLQSPKKQLFSIHNVEIDDDRSDVEKMVGEGKRSSMNDYGVNWVTYHDHYQNFFMVAYNQHNKVAGLYTNQDLLTSELGINFQSSRENVLEMEFEPLVNIRKGFVLYKIQNHEEYDMFHIDHNYVTIFYDQHENNSVTAIQIISEELENNKKQLFAEPSAQLIEGFEYQLFDLTNAARVKHGLSALTWDEATRVTARDHSTDMATHNYFSHTNRQGKSPFERMEEDDIAYLMAGENLAMGQLSSIFAHEGLMNSLGHRENILQKEFDHLGVGVAFNQESTPYYTENFLKK